MAGDFFAANSADVINAIADGKLVAEKIDAYLMGETRHRRFVQVEKADITGRLRDHDLVDTPEMPMLPLAERGPRDEVELGFSPEAADIHAWRCYLCNHKFEIDQDKCIHCDWCIKVSPRNCILRLSRLELDNDGAAKSWTRGVGRAARRRHVHLDRQRSVHSLRELHQRLPGGCDIAAQVRRAGREYKMLNVE